MALEDALRKAAIGEIEQISIPELNRYARQNRAVIGFLYANKIITDGLIESALEKAVIKQAQSDYLSVTLLKVSDAEHVAMPEFLAYAIDHKFMGAYEVKALRFDHGETVESFVKTYRKDNLLSGLRDDLLNPKPVPEYMKGEIDECTEH
jgi:hypothetical protein